MSNFYLAQFTIAQDGQALPPVPGEEPTTPPSGATTTPGAAPAQPTGQPPMGNFVLLVGLAVMALIIFSMMGQRREKKRREATINAIKKHDRVQTIGGVIGSVVEVKPDYVILKVDESSNTRITFSRSAIQQVLSSSPEPAPSALAKGE